MAALDPRRLTTTDARWLRALYDPWRWASETARIRLPKAAGVMDLASRPFLRDVYRDMAPEIVVMKGAQLGMSTTALVRAMWLLTSFPTTAIYTMPTARDVGKFTQGRINPIVRSSQYLLDRIIDVDSVMQKQFVVAPGQLEERRQRGLAFEGPRSTIYFSRRVQREGRGLDGRRPAHPRRGGPLGPPDRRPVRAPSGCLALRLALPPLHAATAGRRHRCRVRDHRQAPLAGALSRMHGRVRAGLPGWALAVCQRRARPLRLDRARLAALGAGRATGTLLSATAADAASRPRIAPAGAGSPRRPWRGERTATPSASSRPPGSTPPRSCSRIGSTPGAPTSGT